MVPEFVPYFLAIYMNINFEFGAGSKMMKLPKHNRKFELGLNLRSFFVLLGIPELCASLLNRIARLRIR